MRNTTRDDHQHESRRRVVIVGAGFGGLEAARALQHAPVQVTVIDQTNHHVFQPLLYQVATAELSPTDISAPIRSVLRHQRNAEVLLGEVTGIDVARRVVEIGRHAAPYDELVLATGGGQSYFGHEEWARYAPGLKTTGDATAIRQRILLAFEAAEMERDSGAQRALMTFVVVGGGPTGVELAGAIAELARKALRADFRHIDPTSAQVVLVEAQERILPTFSPHLAQRAERMLASLGVTVRTSAPVQRVDADGVVIGGQPLAARTVIWAAGVHASPAGVWLGAATDRAGRVLVGSDLSVPDHPDIFVIGDTANAQQDGQPLPGVAAVAKQEGHYVAQVIAARAEGFPSPQPFRYHDRGSLATIGRTYAVGTLGHVELSGLPAWLVWAGVHLTYLIGFRNRALVLFQWLWLYLTFQRGARLLIPAVSADLMAPPFVSAPSGDMATIDVRPEPGRRSA
jgi:NADH dehydrogenase